jgi:hypothetical protein
VVSIHPFLLVRARVAFILEVMQQTAANSGSIGSESAFRDWSSPSSSSTSFAGLLASLTSPGRDADPESNDDELADDVATLSYEEALRTHVRYKPLAQVDGAASQPVGVKTCRACGARRDNVDAAIGGETHPHDPEWDEEPEMNSGLPSATNNRDGKKCASITIRMSKGECEQLKRRAGEAGLTISAYLRSCTFEAEALRAEVKKTLADLRKPAVQKPASMNRSAAAKETRSSWFEWLLRLMTPWNTGQRVARA